MRIQTLFRNLGKSEALEVFVEDKILTNIEHFLKYEPDTNVVVRLDLDRHRTQNRKPSFMCEVIVKSPRSKQTIKVTKAAEDFHTAVSDAAMALRNIMSRRSGKKAQHRRYEHSRELRNLVA